MSTSWKDNFVETLEWKFCFQKLLICSSLGSLRTGLDKFLTRQMLKRISQNGNNQVFNFTLRAPCQFVCPRVFYLKTIFDQLMIYHIHFRAN